MKETVLSTYDYNKASESESIYLSYQVHKTYTLNKLLSDTSAFFFGVARWLM